VDWSAFRPARSPKSDVFPRTDPTNNLTVAEEGFLICCPKTAAAPEENAEAPHAAKESPFSSSSSSSHQRHRRRVMFANLGYVHPTLRAIALPRDLTLMRSKRPIRRRQRGDFARPLSNIDGAQDGPVSADDSQHRDGRMYGGGQQLRQAFVPELQSLRVEPSHPFEAKLPSIPVVAARKDAMELRGFRSNQAEIYAEFFLPGTAGACCWG